MKGKSGRIFALVVQEFYITRRSLEIFFDIFFFPLMNVILFGLLTVFVEDIRNAVSAEYLIMGILLWEVVTITQYNVTVSSLWSVWSHNLTNLFIAPISVTEYLLAHILAGALKTLCVVGFFAAGAWLFFDFNILKLGWLNLLLLNFNLLFFSCWLGIILLGCIFRYGTKIQSISWGLIFLFQPLTAVMFPVSVLPSAIQPISYLLPPTYIFESARKALETPGVDWKYVGIATAMNAVYTVIAAFTFKYLFKRSKETGQFARNDL